MEGWKDKHWLLFIGLCYRGRTFPLVWEVLKNQGATDFKKQATLLKQLLPLLPKNGSVVLLGDREFRSTALMSFCNRRFWHFRLRLKCEG